MNDLELLPRDQNTDVIVDRFLDAAIECFQDRELEQVQIKTNVGYLYSPSISNLSDLKNDPDYQAFRSYLADHPVIKLEQGLIIVQDKQRFDKGGVIKTKTRQCSFTLHPHEDGLRYVLKVIDEIKEGVKFNVRLLEAFAKGFRIVTPGFENQPMIEIGNRLVHELQQINQPMIEIGNRLVHELQQIDRKLEGKEISESKSLDILVEAVEKIKEHHPSVENKKNKEADSWIEKLMIGSIWITSLVFLIGFIGISILSQRVEWHLVWPWAGFTLVFFLTLKIHWTRKMK